MLTNEHFSLPLEECARIRREMEEVDVYLVSLIMRNETKAFHREGESNELFGCLYPSGMFIFRDSFDEVSMIEFTQEVRDTMCCGPSL